MSPFGHHVTAIGSGLVGATLLATPEYSGQYLGVLTESIHWFAQTLIKNTEEPIPLALIALGFFLGSGIGSRAPDYLEFPLFFFNNIIRPFGHRTLTHMPIVWLLLLGFSVFLIMWPKDPFFHLLTWMFCGFCSSALLHVFIDSMSPTGVPMFKPYGRKYVLGPIYRTGGLSEFFVITPVLLIQYALIHFRFDIAHLLGVSTSF